jgi:hypothetical protein
MRWPRMTQGFRGRRPLSADRAAGDWAPDAGDGEGLDARGDRVGGWPGPAGRRTQTRISGGDFPAKSLGLFEQGGLVRFSHRMGLAAFAALAFLQLSGCARTARVCAARALSDEVEVTFSAPARVTKVCLGEQCATVVSSSSPNRWTATFGRAAGPAGLTPTYLQNASRVAVDYEVSAVPSHWEQDVNGQFVEPNGPGCGTSLRVSVSIT